MTKKLSASESAKAVVEACRKYGWEFSIRNESILTISKKFRRGNLDDFTSADMEYYEILSLLPRTSPGSDWGTSGDGIGAMSAINSGVFTMNRSGGSKLVLKQLSKIA